MSCKIIGVGAYLPGSPVSNDELAKVVVDSDSEWVRTRTGILQRYFASSEEYTSHLALNASRDAISDAGIDPSEIDMIIVCTTTPDNSFPSVATKLQGYLAIDNVPSFDLQAVCAGFVYGIDVAHAFLKTGKYNTILLVAAEKMSSLLDMKDRSTAVLFGDGAGAIIITNSDSKSDIIDTKLYSDGKLWDVLYTDGGVSSNGICGTIKMNGKEVYRNAVEKMSSSILELLKVNNIDITEIDYLVPHQANERIIDSIASRLEFPLEKIVKTVAKYANSSAATIPPVSYTHLTLPTKRIV